MLLIAFFEDWTAFFGRFHPLFVHLPIGFLMLIVLFELLIFFKKIDISQEVIRISLLLTTISAIFACFAGYFLSLEGGYNEEILDEHKWQGIWLAVFSALAYLSKNKILSNKFNFIKKTYLPLLIIATILMFVAGHHGGNLTHGETYLTENTPQPFRSIFGMKDKAVNVSDTEKPKIANVNEAKIYQEVIHPIFKEKCEQCHNKSKKKGDLRMDEISLFQKGGKNGVIFKANNVDGSEFIKRILLPENEEKHMPPKGKNQISENELALLKWWVEQGASFDKKVSQLTMNEPIKTILAELGGGMGISSTQPISSVKQDKFDKEESMLSKKVDAIDDKMIEEIKKSGGLILPLAQNCNYVELTYINNKKFADKDANLIAIAPSQTLWLKLNDTQITDKALEMVAKLSNLTRLHLENTKISDNGLAQLQPLQNLEYLNLIGTNITDIGLKKLSVLKNIKKIYCWKSKITQTGVDDFKKSNPKTIIDLGISEQKIAAFQALKADTVSDDVYKKK